MAAHPLNLKVLQRHDTSISSIIDSATYVVLYHYHDDSWKKEGIEGSMFIYRRSSNPPLGLIILNRYGPNNFVRPITQNTEFDIQGKVLMINEQGSQGADAKVSGIWVHDEAEGKKLLDLMTSLRDKECIPVSPPLPSPAQVAPPTAQPPASAPVPAPSSNGSLSFSEILNRLSSPSISSAMPQPVVSQSPVVTSRIPQGPHPPLASYQHQIPASPLRPLPSDPSVGVSRTSVPPPTSPSRPGNGTNLKGNDLLQALFASASNSPQTTPTFSPARVHSQPSMAPPAPPQSSQPLMYAPHHGVPPPSSYPQPPQVMQPPHPANQPSLQQSRAAPTSSFPPPAPSGVPNGYTLDSQRLQSDVALAFVGRSVPSKGRESGDFQAQSSAPLGKTEFMNQVVRLIQTDPVFVDSLYTKYLATSASMDRSERGPIVRGYGGGRGGGADVG